jgi:hypothetical protein
MHFWKLNWNQDLFCFGGGAVGITIVTGVGTKLVAAVVTPVVTAVGAVSGTKLGSGSLLGTCPATRASLQSV